MHTGIKMTDWNIEGGNCLSRPGYRPPTIIHSINVSDSKLVFQGILSQPQATFTGNNVSPVTWVIHHFNRLGITKSSPTRLIGDNSDS